MRRMQVTCGNCAGIGYYVTWEDIGANTLQKKEIWCKECNGNGYTEYAVFSIEEAEAIFKHCGLDKE